MADDWNPLIPQRPKLPDIQIPIFEQRDFGALAKPPMPESMEFPVIEHPSDRIAKSNYASSFHERLVEWIRTFDAELDQSHEVGVTMVSFGQSVTFHLESMGYWNPSLISLKGKTHDGDPVELVQHVSQISILLVKLARHDPSTPKEPIGFYEYRGE